MIYRCHQPHTIHGALGAFIGYISLCHGHINSANIIRSLQQAKFVPEHWFASDALLISGASHNAYLVDRRSPRQHLFYICPVETAEAKAKRGANHILDSLLMGGNSFTIPMRVQYAPEAPARRGIEMDEIRRQLDQYVLDAAPVPRPARPRAAPAPPRRIRPTRNTAMERAAPEDLAGAEHEPGRAPPEQDYAPPEPDYFDDP
jgi:hypothetical protein